LLLLLTAAAVSELVYQVAEKGHDSFWAGGECMEKVGAEGQRKWQAALVWAVIKAKLS